MLRTHCSCEFGGHIVKFDVLSSFLFIVSFIIFFFLQILTGVTVGHVRTVPLVLGITKTTIVFVQKAGKETTAKLLLLLVRF